jgi:5-methylcytosine-specific restriction endonuclease McrA
MTDKLFSDYIRLKSKYRCQRCFRDFSERKEIFDCSHFFTRANRVTRWMEENCAALCRGCHDYMGKNPHEHTAFFMKKLGDKYDQFVQLAKAPLKQRIDEKILRIWLKQEIKKLRESWSI